MVEQILNDHPAQRWMRDAQQQPVPDRTRLRVAAMAGHMEVDKVAARRAALIDLLADGRSHDREEIWAAVAEQVGEACWGKVPHETLARDLATLRRGGIRIAYARRPEIAGYYLQSPFLETASKWKGDSVNWLLIDSIRRLPPAEKNNRAFAAAAFALQQKKLLLAEEHPNWSPEAVEEKARQIVYGTASHC